MYKFVWSLLWFVLLVIVWPLGIICANIYIILGPLAAWFSPIVDGFNRSKVAALVDFVNLAGEGMQLPITVARNMASSKPMVRQHTCEYTSAGHWN